MRAHDKKVLNDTVRTPAPAQKNLIHIEHLGNEAFDYLRGVFEGREEIDGRAPSSNQRANALRRMVLLARQACLDRKGELLVLALAAVGADDPAVRSAAVHVSIGTCTILEGRPPHEWPKELGARGTSELWSAVAARVELGLRLGVEPEVRSFALRALRGHR